MVCSPNLDPVRFLCHLFFIIRLPLICFPGCEACWATSICKSRILSSFFSLQCSSSSSSPSLRHLSVWAAATNSRELLYRFRFLALLSSLTLYQFTNGLDPVRQIFLNLAAASAKTFVLNYCRRRSPEPRQLFPSLICSLPPPPSASPNRFLPPSPLHLVNFTNVLDPVCHFSSTLRSRRRQHHPRFYLFFLCPQGLKFF